MADTRLISGIKFTPAALQEIRNLGSILRIWVTSGGCCGRLISFSLTPIANDNRFEVEGLSIYLDSEAFQVLQGATLDYGVRLKPARFRILRIQNGVQRCPCRRSFGQVFTGHKTLECAACVPMPWLRQT